MVDPQQVASPSFINWTLNVWDLIMIFVFGAVLYSRITTLETKIDPLWSWWNESAERRRAGEHTIG